MTLRLNLGRYLERHHITAYRLHKETRGRVAEATVYALARRPTQRLDLGTVGTVLEALERITGERVALEDLLERVEAPALPNPVYAELLKNARVLTREELLGPGGFTPEELEADEAYWREDREAQRRLEAERAAQEL